MSMKPSIRGEEERRRRSETVKSLVKGWMASTHERNRRRDIVNTELLASIEIDRAAPIAQNIRIQTSSRLPPVPRLSKPRLHRILPMQEFKAIEAMRGREYGFPNAGFELKRRRLAESLQADDDDECVDAIDMAVEKENVRNRGRSGNDDDDDDNKAKKAARKYAEDDDEYGDDFAAENDAAARKTDLADKRTDNDDDSTGVIPSRAYPSRNVLQSEASAARELRLQAGRRYADRRRRERAEESAAQMKARVEMAATRAARLKELRDRARMLACDPLPVDVRRKLAEVRKLRSERRAEEESDEEARRLRREAGPPTPGKRSRTPSNRSKTPLPKLVPPSVPPTAASPSRARRALVSSAPTGAPTRGRSGGPVKATTAPPQPKQPRSKLGRPANKSSRSPSITSRRVRALHIDRAGDVDEVLDILSEGSYVIEQPRRAVERKRRSLQIKNDNDDDDDVEAGARERERVEDLRRAVSLNTAAVGSVKDQMRRLKELLSRMTTDGLRESGLRESGLRESGLRESGLRESGLRESGLRESGLRESGLRDTGLRESGLRESGFDQGIEEVRRSLVARIDGLIGGERLKEYDDYAESMSASEDNADNDDDAGGLGGLGGLEDLLVSRVRAGERDVQRARRMQMEAAPLMLTDTLTDNRLTNYRLTEYLADADLESRPISRSNQSEMKRRKQPASQSLEAYKPIPLVEQFEASNGPRNSSASRYAVGGELTSDILFHHQVGLLQDTDDIMQKYGRQLEVSASEDTSITANTVPISQPMLSLRNVGELKGMLDSKVSSRGTFEVDSTDDWSDASETSDDGDPENDHRIISVFAREILRKQEIEAEKTRRAEIDVFLRESVARETADTAVESIYDVIQETRTTELPISNPTAVERVAFEPEISIWHAEPPHDDVPYRPVAQRILHPDNKLPKSAAELKLEMDIELMRQEQIFNYAVELSEIEQNRLSTLTSGFASEVISQSRLNDAETRRQFESLLQQQSYDTSIANTQAAAQLELINQQITHNQETSELRQSLVAKDLEKEYRQQYALAKATAENFEHIASLMEIERKLTDDAAHKLEETLRENLEAADPHIDEEEVNNLSSNALKEDNDSVIQDAGEDYLDDSDAFENEVSYETSAPLSVLEETVPFPVSKSTTLLSASLQSVKLELSRSEKAMSVASKSDSQGSIRDYSESFDPEYSATVEILEAPPEITESDSASSEMYQETFALPQVTSSQLPPTSLFDYSQLSKEYKEELDRRLASNEKALSMRINFLSNRKKYQLSLLEKQKVSSKGKLLSENSYKKEVARIETAFSEGFAEVERDRWSMHAKACRELRKVQELHLEMKDLKGAHRRSAQINDESSSNSSKLSPSSSSIRGGFEADSIDSYISLQPPYLADENDEAAVSVVDEIFDNDGKDESILIEDVEEERRGGSVSYDDSFAAEYSDSSHARKFDDVIEETAMEIDDMTMENKSVDRPLSFSIVEDAIKISASTDEISIDDDQANLSESLVQSAYEDDFAEDTLLSVNDLNEDKIDFDLQEVEDEGSVNDFTLEISFDREIPLVDDLALEILVDREIPTVDDLSLEISFNREMSTEFPQESSSVNSEFEENIEVSTEDVLSYDEDFEQDNSMKLVALESSQHISEKQNQNEIDAVASTESDIGKSSDTLLELEQSIESREKRIISIKQELDETVRKKARESLILQKRNERQHLIEQEEKLVEELNRLRDPQYVLSSDDAISEQAVEDKIAESPLAVSIRTPPISETSVNIDEESFENEKAQAVIEARDWVRKSISNLEEDMAEEFSVADDEESIGNDSWGSEADRATQSSAVPFGLVAKRIREIESAVVIQASTRRYLTLKQQRRKKSEDARLSNPPIADLRGNLVDEFASTLLDEGDILDDSFASGNDDAYSPLTTDFEEVERAVFALEAAVANRESSVDYLHQVDLVEFNSDKINKNELNLNNYQNEEFGQIELTEEREQNEIFTSDEVGASPDDDEDFRIESFPNSVWKVEVVAYDGLEDERDDALDVLTPELGVSLDATAEAVTDGLWIPILDSVLRIAVNEIIPALSQESSEADVSEEESVVSNQYDTIISEEALIVQLNEFEWKESLLAVGHQDVDLRVVESSHDGFKNTEYVESVPLLLKQDPEVQSRIGNLCVDNASATPDSVDDISTIGDFLMNIDRERSAVDSLPLEGLTSAKKAEHTIDSVNSFSFRELTDNIWTSVLRDVVGGTIATLGEDIIIDNIKLKAVFEENVSKDNKQSSDVLSEMTALVPQGLNADANSIATCVEPLLYSFEEKETKELFDSHRNTDGDDFELDADNFFDDQTVPSSPFLEEIVNLAEESFENIEEYLKDEFKQADESTVETLQSVGVGESFAPVEICIEDDENMIESESTGLDNTGSSLEAVEKLTSRIWRSLLEDAIKSSAALTPAVDENDMGEVNLSTAFPAIARSPLSTLAGLPSIQKKSPSFVDSWNMNQISEDTDLYDFDTEPAESSCPTRSASQELENLLQFKSSIIVSAFDVISDDDVLRLLENPSFDSSEVEVLWQSDSSVSLCAEENRPIYQRVIGIISELHSLRHSSISGGKEYSKRLVACTMPAKRSYLQIYIQRKLDEDQKNISDYLEGRKRLYELVDIRVEDEFNGELNKEIKSACNDITDVIFEKLLEDTINDLISG